MSSLPPPARKVPSVSSYKGQVAAVVELKEERKAPPGVGKAKWVGHTRQRPWTTTGALIPWRARRNRACRSVGLFCHTMLGYLYLKCLLRTY